MFWTIAIILIVLWALGFFAFHILLAYLVDLVQLNAAFWISAVVSVFLVVSYMRLVAGLRFAVVYVGAAQLVYLIGFSYAFMWKGYTGLTVVIGAIVTLFVLMQATGRVNWNEAFARTPANAPPSPLRKADPAKILFLTGRTATQHREAVPPAP